MASLPTLSDGIALTHFIVAEDVERAGRFYSDVLGGEIVLAGQPTIVALAKRWIIIDVGGRTHKTTKSQGVTLEAAPRSPRWMRDFPCRKRPHPVHRPSQPDQTEKGERDAARNDTGRRRPDRFVEVFSSTAAEKRKKQRLEGSRVVFRDPSESDRSGGIFDWDAQVAELSCPTRTFARSWAGRRGEREPAGRGKLVGSFDA